RRGISGGAAGDQVDPQLTAKVELGLAVEVATGVLDLLGKLGPHPWDVAQVGQGSVQDSPGRLEPFQKRAAGLWPHAGDHRQEDQVEDFWLRGRFGQSELLDAEEQGAARRWGSARSREMLCEDLTHVVKARLIGQLDASQSSGQDEADLAALVLLVPAHGV